MSVVELEGWTHRYSGKVRDLYEPAEGSDRAGDGTVLVVASDRISAYDHVLPTPIPDKGKVLTALSLWWFEQLTDLVPHHVVSTDVPAAVAGRAMVCRRLDMFPVECVARGYLTGSGLVEYRRELHGVRRPAAPRPRRRVAAGRTGLHAGDEGRTGRARRERHVRARGRDRRRRRGRGTARPHPRGVPRAEGIARDRGIVLADTKLEFGRADGVTVLGDEVLTPDSSRFWPAETWEPGRAQPSFDKQFVRDWLTSPASGWDRDGVEAPPELPAEVVERTRSRYVEAYERLTGQTFTG